MKLDSIPVVYIAGPYRANTPWGIEQNVRRAEKVGLHVAEMGAIPIIPHTMYRYFQNAMPDQFWLNACKVLLRRVATAPHAALLVAGTRNGGRWLDSEGTLDEIEEIQRLGRPVFFYDELDQLRHWINERINPHDHT